MPATDAYDDREVREFLDRQPRHATYTDLAEACLARFGAGRAWSRSKIIRYWQANHPARKGHPARIDGDREVRAFLDDRMGRLTLDGLVSACREVFPPLRCPSRSSIHRYWQKVRRGTSGSSGGGS